MGLTVHWQLSFEGSRQSVTDILDTLSERIDSTSRSGEMAKPLYIRDGRCSESVSEETLNWIMFLAEKNRGDVPLHPEEMFIVSGDPGEGSESANFFLARYAGEEKWEGSGFCKTQYAEQFVESHLLLIKWLDVLRNEGVETEVYDEGDYWETRDIATLLREYENLSNALGALTEELEREGLEVTGGAPELSKRRKKRLN